MESTKALSRARAVRLNGRVLILMQTTTWTQLSTTAGSNLAYFAHLAQAQYHIIIFETTRLNIWPSTPYGHKFQITTEL
jgi:hypothetical protein